MKYPSRFRLFMILQLCLGFSVLVWLLICPPILERADKRARDHLVQEIYQQVESYPQYQLLNKVELEELPSLLDQEITSTNFYPSNLLLTLGLLLANAVSLCLLLSYQRMKWLGLPSLLFLMSAFSYLPMPAIPHPLLDPRATSVKADIPWSKAQEVWQEHLVNYYRDKIDASAPASVQLELAKTFFEYDLLKSHHPIPGGFFFPASFWLLIVAFLHGLWLVYILLRA